MNELIQLHRGKPTVSSRRVAEDFGKNHQHIMEKIRGLTVEISTAKMPEEFTPVFIESTYMDSRGKVQPEYLMNRDGFTELVSNLNGKKAREWKRKYHAAFNRMEKVLTERQTEAWMETRRIGKLTRRSETDVIKELVAYANGQGSAHADMLYMTYSKLANKVAGISKRDLANIKQLNILDDVESMILHVVQLGMAAGKHYKDIYKDCKRRLEWWQDCTFRLT